MKQENALTEYDRKMAEIKKLLKEIETGLEKHDHKASKNGGHHWGHVGDLTSYLEALQEISDQLHGTGEYAEVGKTW